MANAMYVTKVDNGKGVATAYFYDAWSEFVWENVRIQDGPFIHIEERVVCGHGKKGWL